ncbi:MAG: hypothetical protein ABIT23_07560 [Nitrosospira sp.]
MRDIPRLTLAAAIYLACILGSFGNVAFSGPGAAPGSPQKTLTIAEEFNVPIAELSGLAITRTLKDKSGNGSVGTGGESINLYAVGDASYEIARFRIDGASGAAIINAQDVADIVRERKADTSQWEAIATDGRDTLCILSESGSEISCLDHRLEHHRGSFTLDVSSIGHLNAAWKARPNSRGEGMILMKKGHVLVLKEKQPAMLIEFGPEGDSPMGYGPAAFLQDDEEFTGLRTDFEEPIVYRANRATFPFQRRLVALKTWEFSEHLRELATDASEIALGPDGSVYLLSQESATLIRLQKILKPDEDKVSLDRGAYWNLPAGLEKAEGLAIDDDMHPWIGIDIKQASKPNLFRLSPIDASPE